MAKASDLTAVSDEELLQQLESMAAYMNREDILTSVHAREISERISRNSILTSHDVALVRWLVKKAQEMQGADFDLPRESRRMRKLGKQYALLKKQVLERMEGEI